MMHPNILGISAVLLFVGACSDRTPHVETDRADLGTDCGPELDGSSWVADGANYELLSTYGRQEGQELVDVWGVATTPNGQVLVWDAGDTRIQILSENLIPVLSAGGQGEGPGEFVYQRVPHGDWITADDSSFVVLGLGTGVLSRFGLDGGFIRSPTRQPPFPLPIVRIQLIGGRILYGVDAINRQDGTRVLETWQLASEPPHVLVRSDQMPTLPRWRGRPIRNLPMQADPLWAVGRECVYISDGSSDWIVAATLAGARSDTLQLPARVTLEPTDADREAWRQMFAEMRLMGFAPAGLENEEPTARAKWAGLVVDPDGFVWLEPWRPPSLEGAPVRALVLNPRTGHVDSVQIPRFPAAFLPEGEFVTLATHGISPVVEKYGKP